MSEVEALLAKYDIRPPRCGAGCGNGWLPLIEALIVDLIALGWDRNCAQVKEKLGSLRFYIDGVETPEIRARIGAAESLSSQTCERCGKPGRILREGWVLACECEDCHKLRLERNARTLVD